MLSSLPHISPNYLQYQWLNVIVSDTLDVAISNLEKKVEKVDNKLICSH